MECLHIGVVPRFKDPEPGDAFDLECPTCRAVLECYRLDEPYIVAGYYNTVSAQYYRYTPTRDTKLWIEVVRNKEAR